MLTFVPGLEIEVEDEDGQNSPLPEIAPYRRHVEDMSNLRVGGLPYEPNPHRVRMDIDIHRNEMTSGERESEEGREAVSFHFPKI